MKLYLYIFAIIFAATNLPSSLSDSNGIGNGNWTCYGDKLRISFHEWDVHYVIPATCSTKWIIQNGAPHVWPFNVSINNAAPVLSTFTYYQGGLPQGLRAYVGIGNVTSGACLGDLVANVAIYSPKGQPKECACRGGLTELRSVFNYIVIAGDTCGVNVCSGNKVNYFTPGITY